MVHALGKNNFFDETQLGKMIIFSGIIHFLAFSLLLILPGLTSQPWISALPQYTSVSLVSLGELPGGNASVKPVVIPKAKAQTTPKKPIPIQKQVEITKVEPKKIEIPQKITPAKEKPDKKEPEQFSQQTEAQLQQAIGRIREKVGSGVQGGAPGVIGTRDGTGGNEAPEMVVYTSIVIDRIMEAWFLPPGLKQEAINQGLLTIIDIKINRDGGVTFQGIERSSGNSLYDDFALAAIKKIQADSFPPLPEVFRSPFLDLGIRFHPSEVSYS